MKHKNYIDFTFGMGFGILKNNAGVMELADMQDLGSCAYGVQVQVLSPAP